MQDILHFTKIDDRAITPTRNNPTDAGLDLYTLEDVVVRPGEIVKIKTGIQIALNDGETALFWDRSGLAGRGLTVLGGCIDGPYRGELIVVATNTNSYSITDRIIDALDDIKHHDFDGAYPIRRLVEESTVYIPYGKAVTQMLVVQTKFPVPTELSTEDFIGLGETSRGDKGFGSSDGTASR